MFDYDLLGNEFNNIIEKRNNIKSKYKTLEDKLIAMKTKYTNLVESNKRKIFIYCLDSFFFQYKILLLELEHYNNIITSLFSRMYGDYYKLLNVIIEKCKEINFTIEDIGSMENIQAYKDVENKLEYKTEDLLKLHNNILVILKQMTIFYEKRDKEIKAQDETSDIGFSITSFIDTLSYENRTLYEQINLYNSYLQFYHSSQNSYLDKTYQKMNVFMNDIEKEIMTNHKNIKTESMSKFNMIKRKFNSGTLLNTLKKTENDLENREPNEIVISQSETNDIIKTKPEFSVSEDEPISDINQDSSDNDDIIDQSNE
jgi:hypothetical protein